MDKKKLLLRGLLIFAIIGGIYYLTESFLMTLGIMLLLFVVDHFIQEKF